MEIVILICAFVLVGLGFRQLKRKDHIAAIILWLVGLILIALIVLSLATFSS